MLSWLWWVALRLRVSLALSYERGVGAGAVNALWARTALIICTWRVEYLLAPGRYSEEGGCRNGVEPYPTVASCEGDDAENEQTCGPAPGQEPAEEGESLNCLKLMTDRHERSMPSQHNVAVDRLRRQ